MESKSFFHGLGAVGLQPCRSGRETSTTQLDSYVDLGHYGLENIFINKQNIYIYI